MEEDTRSQAKMPLVNMPQHWYLQQVCLSVHIFASLYNISARTLCAMFSCENSVRKASTFLGASARLENIAVRSVFALTSTEPMVPVGDFDHSQNASRECDTQKTSSFRPTATRHPQNVQGRNQRRYL